MTGKDRRGSSPAARPPCATRPFGCLVEYDALTGVAKPGGATFETYLGKILEPKFLFDVTVETANIFFPGATLARVIVNKSLEFKKR